MVMFTSTKRAADVGFADGKDVLPKVVLARPTLTKGKATRGVMRPATSTGSVFVGFADEDSSEESMTTSNESVRELSVSSDDVAPSAERNSIAYFFGFIENSEKYDFSTSILKETHECVRTRRAVSETARGLVRAISDVVANAKRDAHQTLGCKDGIIGMTNPVLQWLI